MDTVKNNAPELLSPVGDMERLESALNFGADAVYLAGKVFGMRAAPANFDDAQLEKAIEKCHSKNVRVYVTCNTIPHNSELKELPGFLEHLNNSKADGVIVADLGVLEMAKKYAPNVDVHISTQAGIANYSSANAFWNLGAKRVVLARELSFNEIAEIRAKTPKELQIEAFVHGAMCVSFSGRCLLSSYMTGRDANRGDCSQPCRWEYDLVEKKRPTERFSIEERPEEGVAGSTYIMNSKDMCMINYVPELMKTGITSFKLEGRAKSAYYVACVTGAYRAAIDFAMANPGVPLPAWITDECEKISHREYSTGFYLGTQPGQNINSGGYIREWDVAAMSMGNKGEYLELSQRNRFFKGDVASVLEQGKEPYLIEIDEMYDKYMNLIEVAPHAQMTVLLKTSHQISQGAYLRIQRKA